jgi:hypothetical protein
MDIDDFNRRWLKAWTDRNVEALLGFYDKNAVFRGPSVPDGVFGTKALRIYLSQQFSASPPIIYEHDEAWPIPNGYCARWYARMERPEGVTQLRGFDLVIHKNELIVLNEVYLHHLPSKKN